MSSLLGNLIGPNAFADMGSRNPLTPASSSFLNIGQGVLASDGLSISAGTSGQVMATDGLGGITWANYTTPNQRNLPHILDQSKDRCIRCGHTLETLVEDRLLGNCQPKITGTTAHLLIVDDPAKPDDHVDAAAYLMQMRKLQDSINKRLSADLHGFIAGNPHYPRRKVLLLCGI